MEQITYFNDFYTLTKTLTPQDKGSLFEKFTLHLFQLDLRLNQHLESIWLYSDIPANILKELNLPSKDKGIDLLAKIDSDYYAIQCKFRQNPEITVKWNELATFFGLSFGINNKIKGGFFVTNTFNLCEEVKKTEKVFTIYGSYFDELSDVFFKNLRMSLTNQNKKVYVSKTPRFYQDMCKYATSFSLIEEDRCHIEMACGTGKTLISYWIFHGLAFNRTVIFVPSLYLLSQFYSDWVNQSYADYQSYICPYFEQLGMRKRKLNFLLVGSDADVDNDTEEKTNGLVMHTDPKEIRKYINTHLSDLVVLCTYQSADKLAQACEKKIIFDFAIFDEAHKTVGQVGNKFTLMLNDDHLIIRKRLFMTATPKIYRGDVENPEVISMCNPAIYGEKCYVYNTGNAIEEGVLTDYQVLVIYARNPDIEQTIKEKKLVKYKKVFDNMEANYLAIILMILKEFNNGTINHLITYHNRVASSETFAEYLRIINKELYGTDIFIEHLDGGVSMSKRKKLIKSFSDAKKGILCSARVLNEGVNIPCIDSVCFIDDRNSTIDIVQCVGRALRLYPEKMLSYVLVPVFVDEFNEDSESFGDVCRILKALKSTDKTIAEYFSLKANGIKPKRKKLNLRNYHEEEVDYSEMIDLDKWCEGIESCVWKRIDTFETRLIELRKFVEENGRLPSHHSKNRIEQALGRFCSKQRNNKKNGKLSDDRIDKLNSVPNWFWEINLDDVFDEKINELCAFSGKNNRLPSTTSNNRTERALGLFCGRQRQKKKNGTLSDNRINKLNYVPNWFWEIDLDDAFDEKINELRAFSEKNKRLPYASSKNRIEQALGRFCQTQRKHKNQCTLSNYRINKLNTISNWNWGLNDVFDEKINELRAFFEKNKRLPSTTSKNRIERLLGQFCNNQRQNKKNGKLSVERINKLNSVPNWFWEINLDDAFDEKINELHTFSEKNNRLPSRGSKNKIEQVLGHFCQKQRQYKKQGTLSNYRINKLNSVPNWSWGFDDLFDEKINELRAFSEKNNRLPSEHSKNRIERALGHFCSYQRKNKKNGNLSNDRIYKLNLVPNWFWEVNLGDVFDQKINELRIFSEKNGHLPSHHAKNGPERSLGHFCQTQRKNKKNGKLSDDRIDKLNLVPNWFWSK